MTPPRQSRGENFIRRVRDFIRCFVEVLGGSTVPNARAMIKLTPLAKLGFVVVLACSLPGSAVGADVTRKSFDVPAGDAEKSLKLFSVQSGREVLFSTETTSDIRTNAVRGEFSPAEAAQKLLTGTRLQAIENPESGTFVVSRGEPARPPAANATPDVRSAPPVTPAMPRRAPAAKDEVVEMSPFQVNADQDRGYQAGNTTSGTRLNTKLKDTPAPISVFTPEFLSDIAANSVTEMLEYATNVEPEFSDANQGFGVGNMTSPDVNVQEFRMRGMGASVSTDLVENNSVSDNYNIERVELSSGPNSVLFGLGEAGGLVALSTKRANLHRDKGTLRAQFGSWKRQRYEADYNKVIVPGKLALRLMAVDSDTEGWRHWMFEDFQGWTGAAVVQPWKTTTINLSYARGDHRKDGAYPGNPQDQVTLWFNSGRPARAAATAALGIASIGANQRFTLFEDGTVISLRNRLQSAGYSPNRTGNLGIQVSPDVLPYDFSVSGPAGRRTQDSTDYKANIEHRFTRSFSVEFAYLHTDSGTTVFSPAGTEPQLRGDPNLTLPTAAGTATIPNPQVGQLYLENVKSENTTDFENDVLRLTAAYELEAGKWGRHRFAVLGETGKLYRFRHGGQEILVDDNNVPIFNAAVPEEVNNRLYRRHYAREGDYTTYSYPDNRAPLPAINIGGKNYHLKIVNDDITGESIKLTDSLMFAMQNYWWNDRLVTTYGYRVDKIGFKDGLSARAAASDPRVATGQLLPNEWANLPGQFVRNDFRAITRTAGAVFHATSRFSVFYNQSSNVGAPRLDRKIIPGVLPFPTTGRSKDMGIMFDALGDGRLFARATYFDTKFLRDTAIGGTGSSNYYVTGTNAVLAALLRAGRITAAEFDAHSVRFGAFMVDVLSKGWEVELVANPTKNWTVRAGYSHSDRNRANYFGEREPYFSQFQALVDAKDPGRNLQTENGSTIREEIADIESEIATVSASQLHPFGSRPHKANITTKYSFGGTRLKGAFVGGGYKFQSKNFMQSDTTLPEAQQTGRKFYGEPIYSADAFVGYQLKLPRDGMRLLFQLNVYNVFNDSLVAPARLNNDLTGMRRIYLREPRTWRFTTTLTF